MSKSHIRNLILFFVLLIIDQFTKHLAVVHLKPDSDGIAVIPGVFRLLYLENTGSAFGMFQKKAAFLLVITAVFIIILFFVFLKIPNTGRFLPLKIIFVFLLSGSVGNYIDRIMNKYVVDFLYFELINFPIFNVADIYVTVSAFLLVLLVLFYYKDSDLEDCFRSLF